MSFSIKSFGKIFIAVLGLCMFIPLAQAANPLIQNVSVTPTPFFSNVPNQSASLSVSYHLETGGYPTAPVLEQIKDSNSNNVVFEAGNIGPDNKATGDYQFTWDGKYKNGGANDGQYVPDGKYYVYIYVQTASPPPATYNSSVFDVAQTKAPILSLSSQPGSVYYKGSGNYSVNYILTRNSGSAWITRLKIKSLSTPDETTIASAEGSDGNKTVSWDGKFNGAAAVVGSYSYELWTTASVNGYSVESTHLTGNFAVSNPAAPSTTVGSLNVTPNPYDPTAGLLNLSYSLSNSSGAASVNAAVYSTTNLNNALKTWAFTNQANGSNTMTWDGRDAVKNMVPDGSYVFIVNGFDGQSVIVTQQANFTVATQTPANNCAGFKDVPNDSPDCPAITYVQSTGAMTGNPDGTFAPQDLLQRDQIMKIVLESFKKFDKQVDYCAGIKPFPDVTENDWAFQYICRAKQLAITTGYQSGPDKGFYRPSRTVNRIEFLALVLRNLAAQMPANTAASYDDVALNQWFTGFAKYAYDHLLFNHPNLFPTNFMVRVEVARVLFKLHQQGQL